MKFNPNKFTIAIINDEVSSDIDKCIQYIKEWGIETLELRSLNGVNLLDVAEKELEVLKNNLDNNKISVSFISTPLFKWYPDISKGLENINKYDLHSFNPDITHNQKIFYIDKAIKVLHLFNVNKIRIFSLIRSETIGLNFYRLERDLYDYLFEKAADNNIEILIENEPSCNLYKKEDLQNINEIFNDNKVNLLLDIGNIYSGGEELNYEEIDTLLDKSSYIHIKDFNTNTGKSVQVGTGCIDYPLIIKKLKTNIHRDLYLSLEPHLTGDIKAVKASINYLQKLIQ